MAKVIRAEPALLAVGTRGGKVLIPKHPIGPYGFRAVAFDSPGRPCGPRTQTKPAY